MATRYTILYTETDIFACGGVCGNAFVSSSGAPARPLEETLTFGGLGRWSWDQCLSTARGRIFTSGGVCCLQSTRWTSGYREYPQATLLDFSSGRLSFCQLQLVGKDISVSPSVQFAPRHVGGQEIITREKDCVCVPLLLQHPSCQ